MASDAIDPKTSAQDESLGKSTGMPVFQPTTSNQTPSATDFANANKQQDPPKATEPAKPEQKETSKTISFASAVESSQLASENTAACRAYVDQLMKLANEKKIEHASIVTGTVDSRVFFDRLAKVAVAVIFAGTTGITNKRPVSDKVEEVISIFTKEDRANIHIVTSLVIDDSSYDRAEQTIAAIKNIIDTCVNEDNSHLNGDSFNVTYGHGPVNMVVSTKPEAYREYIKRISPFSFPERDDIGFLVGYPKATCPNSEKFDVKPETHHILFAVEGYTQFVRKDRRNVTTYTGTYNGPIDMYRPVIHITGIISQTPSMVFLPPAIVIAVQTFATLRNWRRPYLNVNGKEKFNVGNLIVNTDNVTGARNTYTAESPFNAEQAINTCCVDPIVCLDITSGRFNIPGIDCLAQKVVFPSAVDMAKANKQYFDDLPENKFSLTNIMRRFWGKSRVNEGSCMQIFCEEPIIEFTGSIALDNQIMDSRHADYLRLFKILNDFAAVDPIIIQNSDPALHLQQIQDLTQTPTKCLYRTTSVILSKLAIEFLSSLCSTYELDITYDQRFSYSYNTNDAASLQGLSFGNAGIPAGYGYGNVSPFPRWV